MYIVGVSLLKALERYYTQVLRFEGDTTRDLRDEFREFLAGDTTRVVSWYRVEFVFFEGMAARVVTVWFARREG